jgi:hypothetical protein
MRSTCKTAVVALLAVLSVGAIASASASAAECPGTVEGGGIALCSGGHEQKGSFAFSGQKQSGTTMRLYISEYQSYIECEKSELSKGSFVAATGKLEISGLYVELSHCVVSGEPTLCEVSPILIDGSEGKGTGPGLAATLKSTGEVTLHPGTGTRWGVIHIKSAPGRLCTMAAISGSSLTGEQKCALPGSTIEAVKHVLECRISGSKLKIAGHVGELELTAEIGLTSGNKWSLQQI